MQFIFKKAILIAIFARKCNHKKIASKKCKYKKTALKDNAFNWKNAYDNKKINRNVNNFFAKKDANKNYVKKIYKIIFDL